MISNVLGNPRLSASGTVRPVALACAGGVLAVLLTPAVTLAQWAPPPMSTMSSSFLEQQQTPPAVPGSYGSESALGRGPASDCFYPDALSGVVASNDRETILRFGSSRFYRVRLTRACPGLTQPGTRVEGVTRAVAGAICRPSDVELKVVSSDGSVSRCTAATLSAMGAAEVTAASAPVAR